MLLKVVLDGQVHPLTVPDELLTEAADLFAKMDADMDKGWQMSRTWVDDMGPEQRCQVVADKLLTAMENENPKMGALMAAYILSKFPGLDAVDIDTSGDMTETRLLMAGESY